MPRTVGISPKLVAAVVTAIITYLLGQTVLDLPAWAVVTGQAVLVALAAYAASPGTVTDDEDGVTLVEVGVACGIVALAVVVLALADVVKL